MSEIRKGSLPPESVEVFAGKWTDAVRGTQSESALSTGLRGIVFLRNISAGLVFLILAGGAGGESNGVTATLLETLLEQSVER